jgi:hypothetical protein
MIIVNIEGYPSHLFKEGSGYFVEYKRRNSNTLNRKSNNYIKKESNSYTVRMSFNALDFVKRNINSQKYSNFFKEDKEIYIKPYNDTSNEYIDLPLNTSFYRKNIGHYDNNESQLNIDFDYFKDRHKFETIDYIGISESEMGEYPHPIRFNDSDFYRRGARIEVFDSVKRIQQYSFGVDSLKGIKGSSFSNGVNGIKENVHIKNYTIKDQMPNSFFEDGILEGILYNSNDKYKVEYNDHIPPVLVEVKTNRHSNEPRFVTFNSQKTEPFKDVASNKRDILVNNDSNFFYNKLRDESLNDILILNRNNNNIYDLEEEKIYSKLGKAIDYSKNTGEESFFYHESID